MTKPLCTLLLLLAASAAACDSGNESNADGSPDGADESDSSDEGDTSSDSDSPDDPDESDSNPDSDSDSDSEDDDDEDDEDEDEDADDEDDEDDGPVGDGADCGSTLVATIRDFSPTHTDFENVTFKSAFATPGLVQPKLGLNQKPVHAGFVPVAPAPPQLTGAAEFDQWYLDVPNVNQAFEVEITLTDNGAGTFVYDNQAFFPIDGKGLGDAMRPDEAGALHNFHFTTEIHTEFEYRGGEVFTFIGDDDLWLFINGKLAIDLGGLHPKLTGTVNLDVMASAFGIVPGKRYQMDIFHAERHTTASTFRIETTIGCLVPVIL